MVEVRAADSKLTPAGVRRCLSLCAASDYNLFRNHIGQQGSFLYFASRYAGYQTSLYDGSFEDWSGRSELPLVGPVKK